MSIYERNHIPITDELIKEIERLAKYGMRIREIAYAIGMGESTLYAKMKNDTRIRDAMGAGKSRGVKKALKVLYKTAIAGTNLPATMFYVKLIQGANREDVDYEGMSDSDDKEKKVEVINTGDVADMTKQYLKFMTTK